MENRDVFDWADFDPPATRRQDDLVEWLTSDAQRPGTVAQRPGVNPVTGHGRGCQCNVCPWYDARAAGYYGAPERSTAPPERQPRPLADQVIPVVILMVTFSLCAMVVVPVVTPLVALGAMSLGLVAVALTVVSIVGLTLVVSLKRSAREAGEASGARVARGKVIRWR